MAVYNTMELDIHRLLPHEILEDIGIVNTDELRTMAVVEELASRLNAILGSAMERGQRHALPPAARAASSCQPQVGVPVGWSHMPGCGDRKRLMAEARPFLSHEMMLDVAVCLPRFAPAWPPLPGFVLPPAKQGGAGTGTGVFLPSSGAGGRQHSPRNTKPSGNGARAESRYRKQQCRQKQRLRSE